MRPLGFTGHGVSNPTLVAAGAVLAANSIPVSTSGAQVGDVIMVVSPNGTITGLTGTGWAQSNYSWYGIFNYPASWAWKILDTLADIAVTGDTASTQYAIYRNCTSVARVVGTDASGPPYSVTWPAPNAACKGQVMMAHMAGAPDLVPPAGWTERYDTVIDGTYQNLIADRLTGVAAGAVTITGGSATYTFINGIELRG